MHIHRRQFIVGSRPVEAAPGWITTTIPGLVSTSSGLEVGYLSHCPELRVASTRDARGNLWVLLGVAVQTDAQKRDPLDELAAATPATIRDVYRSWAGRWVLIGDGKLHMDASGLLGCFHTSRDVHSESWVSSSPAVLATVLGVEATPERPLYHGRGIDWYPPPHAGFASIRRLLPSQILAVASGELLERRLIPEVSETLGYEDLLDKLQDYLVTALERAATLSRYIWLPVTAGYDSRVLLAAAHHAKLPVKAYTHRHKYLQEADLTMPPKLAGALGIDHVFHGGRGFKKELAALYDAHTARHCVDRDRYYVSRDFFTWCNEQDLILRGGCFEIGRCYYWKTLPKSAVPSEVPSTQTISKGLGQRPTPEVLRALDAWKRWADATPHPELDWRDRFYLEQRLGGWLSSVEQSLDLIGAERFHAVNSHAYFSYVLQLPEEIRCTSRHQVDLVARLAPRLAGLPFNPSGSPLRRTFTNVLKATEVVRARLRT